jgi:protein gp37
VSWREHLFYVIDDTPWLDWQLLTKRPENIQEMWPARMPGSVRYYHESTVGLWRECGDEDAYRPNVWLGTSVSNQVTLEQVCPKLYECRDLSPVLFLSGEPLVSPIDLRPISELIQDIDDDDDGFPDWVIVGGESGPKARPYNVRWAAEIIEQCQRSETPVFHKQLGSRPIDDSDPAHPDFSDSAGYRSIHTVDKKGGDPDEWPPALRVRKFPRVMVV